MKKFFFVLLILIIVAGAVWYALLRLDPLIEAAIEEHGSAATGTAVRVAGVKTGLVEGVASVNGLKVANPAGFESANAVALDQIKVQLDPESVAAHLKADNNRPPIVIKEVRVSNPVVTYEINDKGQANFNIIKSNVGKGSSAGSSAGDSGKPAPEFIINHFIIEGGEVTAMVAALGDELTTPLPKLHLRNIGTAEGGATPKEIAETVVKALVDQVGPAVKKLGVEKYVGKKLEEVKDKLEADLKEKVNEQINDKVGDKLKDALGGEAGDALKGLFGN